MQNAIKTIYELVAKYTGNSQVYCFSNENIAAYLAKNPRMDGARVLAVCSSGDHAFESLLAGASHVDTFDINFIQQYVLELKSKMIRYLPYDHFMNYFFDTKHPKDIRILRPIWKKLSLGTRIFVKYAPEHMWHPHRQFTKNMVSYIQDDKIYNILQERMPDTFNFFHSDVGQLGPHLVGKYDVILLSNIIDYFITDYNSPTDLITQYYHRVLSPLARRTFGHNGGDIYFEYTWSTLVENTWINRAIRQIISTPDYRQDFLPNHTLEIQTIPTAEKFETYRDVVAVMHQRAR